MKRISILMFGFCVSGLLHAGQMGADQILSSAQERIERCRTTEIEIKWVDSDNKPLPAGTEVLIEQVNHHFLFGCNIFKFDQCRSQRDNQLYKQRFAELFNFATFGFYWGSYEPDQGQTNAARWKTVAKWCKENHITTKGHPLFWTIEPAWAGKLPADQGQDALFGRIDREIKDFAGLVAIWDVLNEPGVGIKQGTERNAAAAVRAYKTLGTTGTIAKAFKIARNASAEAILILNDYDTGKQFEDTLQDCLDQGVEIDVVGIQSHQHSDAWSIEKTWDICQRFARFGKPLHFTETTFVSGPGKWDDWQKTTPEGEKQQAEQVERFYTILFSHPAVEAITWWDLSDQKAWQNAPAGLLRDDMSTKPAYDALRKLIRQTWWTKETLPVDAAGKVKLRAFYGQYRATVKIGREAKTCLFTIDKGDSAKTVGVK